VCEEIMVASIQFSCPFNQEALTQGCMDHFSTKNPDK